jgi:hypothetical protein
MDLRPRFATPEEGFFLLPVTSPELSERRILPEAATLASALIRDTLPRDAFSHLPPEHFDGRHVYESSRLVPEHPSGKTGHFLRIDIPAVDEHRGRPSQPERLRFFIRDAKKSDLCVNAFTRQGPLDVFPQGSLGAAAQ